MLLGSNGKNKRKMTQRKDSGRFTIQHLYDRKNIAAVWMIRLKKRLDVDSDVSGDANVRFIAGLC